MLDSTKIQELLTFLDASPSPWHALAVVLKKLQAQGFELLQEQEAWNIKPEGRYVVLRDGSSLLAFILPKNLPIQAKIAASHTDSPTFKLKPQASFQKENMTLLGLEMYGSPLLSSWLNRDLGIAGRIFYQSDQEILQKLVCLDRHPVVIPQLAIHLDRQVNENGLILNKQEQLQALAALEIETDKKNAKSYLEDVLLKEELQNCPLLGHDLFVYPLEKARLVGYDQQLLASYRLDSLSSVQAALAGFLESQLPSESTLKMLALSNHEEIGSLTAQGANSPFLLHCLERICLGLNYSREQYLRLLPSSFCLSIDLAHALHPNYSDKHELRHPILLHKGIVIKSSAQQRYASNAPTTAVIVDLCKSKQIPYQHFVSKGDIPAGTTIGPLYATVTGIPTVDVGCPQLSMHACRELMSCADQLNLCRLTQAFFHP